MLDFLTLPISAHVKIRYKAKGMSAKVTPLPENRVEIEFVEPVFGATAGQGAVFFAGDVCLGGGIIEDEVNIPQQDSIPLELSL